ncbi:hypothetical protein COU57_05820 [Candidatus Pacearchaeota archaeon CG10_big_fil_rev_8_21_14_0_10_32_14]|nr:MAG: hypothetical protein COU57_05820 [Candidatus Pacearchaeota archaeon CG10_big_fil_rev_8_21_14_0_10_32_14]
MLKGGRELSFGGIRVSQDRRLRYAPKESYPLGDHTIKSLEKDGYVIGSYGESGAEKLADFQVYLDVNLELRGLIFQKDKIRD